MLRIEIDHLLLATPDLDLGCDFAERLLGVRPAYGGVHPGMGTRNALLGLAGDIYLEVIAPDPDQSPDLPLADYISGMEGPALSWWAARTADIDELEAGLQPFNLPAGGIEPGSRALPGGGELSWRTLMATAPEFGSALPFFIEWGDMALHPARNAPAAGELAALEITHPEAGPLRSILGGACKIEPGGKPVIRAEITTPGGPVSLVTPKTFPPAIGSVFDQL